jgi:hypothetical protein
MAHFAKLNKDNIVTHISVVDNKDTLDNSGYEGEVIGIAYLQSVHGNNTNYRWRQTSYNGTFRKNYAGVGYTYDSSRDAFIAPQNYPSWILNETTCQWESPVAYPDDDKVYSWDELTTNWVESV